MRFALRILTVTAMLSATSGETAFAYQICPNSLAKIAGKHPIHEALTLATIKCATNPKFSDACEIPELAGFYPGDGSISNKAWLQIIEGVRWPDDPTRMAQINRGIALFGWQMKKFCAANHSVENGLLCMSHFGPLQILHAMAPDATNKREDVADWIRNWAHFLIDVANGTLDGETVLAQIGPKYGYINSQFSGVWIGNPPSDRKKWTVKYLFMTDCSKMRLNRKCNWVGEATEEHLRRVAFGALLHLLQDAYASGHARRFQPERPAQMCTAVMDCSDVRYFASYDAQDGDLHDIADHFPSILSTCTPSNNPVVFGARLYRAVFEQKKNVDTELDDILNQVLRLAPAESRTERCFNDSLPTPQ